MKACLIRFKRFYSNRFTLIIGLLFVFSLISNIILIDETNFYSGVNVRFQPETSDVYDIVINEFLPDPYTEFDDEWVELYNPTDTMVDLTGCILNDSQGNEESLDGYSINAKGFYVFNYTSSVLNNPGDEVKLVDNSGGIPVIIDSHEYSSNPGNDISIGREWDGALSWVTFSNPTNGTSNGDPPLFPILISEVHYSGTGMEWIELTNNYSVPFDLTDYSLYSYNYFKEVKITSGTITPHGTFVIGELPAIVDFEDNITLQDSGDVLELRNPDGRAIDVVVWGSGNATFIPSPSNGWLGSQNATENLPEGQSIFRYNKSSELLADTNSTNDWYATSKTTPNSFYTVEIGDVLISEVGVDMDNGWEFVEIFNNRSWPIVCDGMQVWTATYDDDLTIDEVVIIPARDVIVVGDNAEYNDTEPLFLTGGDTYVSLYDASGTLEYDTVLWDDGGNYDGSGWIGTTNVTGSLDNSTTIHRLRTEEGGLNDSNTYTDWFVGPKSMWELPDYVPPPPPEEDLLISEVMYGGSEEWIEFFNNGSEQIDLSGFKIYAYANDNETVLDPGTTINPNSTLVLGEPTIDFDLRDIGDVLVVKNSSDDILDVVVWGSGASTFDHSSEPGWIGSSNASGGLLAGESIFRFNRSRRLLADTNSNEDWYNTTEPTPDGFYAISIGDVLISEVRSYGTPEFIEIYNKLKWPLTLDGMSIWDYSANEFGGEEEFSFEGIIYAMPNNVITAGEDPSYDYEIDHSISFHNDGEDVVLYYRDNESMELDVVIYGDELSYYNRDSDHGWNTIENVTAPGGPTQSLQRIRDSTTTLKDTNTTADWIITTLSAGLTPDYSPPAAESSILITEVMHDPSPATGAEYIEIYNTLNVEVDLSHWKIFRDNPWGGTAETVLPLGTTISAKSHLTILDDEATCLARYDIVGDYYGDPDGFTLDNGPGQAILVDFYDNIIDRVAWESSSTEFVEDIDANSWQGGGVFKGSSNKTIARLYDPLNPENYIDTNSSDDWRYSMFIAPGNHTNEVWFLSTPISDTATVTAFSSPDNSYAAIIDLISNAENTIDMSVYQFTSYHILQHLISAMDRGVKVRLLLEDIYPLYDSPYTSDSTHDAENYEVVYVATQVNNHENGTVKWENDPYFRYSHAKYFIVDHEVVVISTENFKYTGIPKDPSAGNRGWGIAVNSSQIASKYLTVYNFDWSLGLTFNTDDLITGYKNDDVIYGSYTPISDYQTYENIDIDCQTVVGPDETIDVVVDLIDSAQECIYVEVFYLYPTWTGYPGGTNNNPFLQAITDAADRGVDVKVILDSTDYNIDGDNDNDEAADIMEQHGVEVKFSKNEDGIDKFHVKALIVDNSSVMISSLNWNENSATNNREIGIIVNSSIVSQYYVDLFASDWGSFSSDEATSSQPDDDPNDTYFWKFWLPIVFAAFMGILVVGYFVRSSIEKNKVRKAVDLTIIHQASKEAREKLQNGKQDTQVPEFDLKFDELRQLVYKAYGDKVKVAKVDPNGKQLDVVNPSQFVKKYIKTNHEMIPHNTIEIPIPHVIVLKYGPDKYLSIDSGLDLTPRLYEFKRILSTHKN